jgi:hypothetical protein
MDSRAEARKYFIEAVNAHPKASSDLKQALNRALKRKNQRLETFIDNLGREITIAKAAQLKSGKPQFSPQEIKWVVKEMTDLFVLGIEGEANRRIESDLARLAREQAAQNKAELDATLEGNPQGAFAEMGIITDEKTLGPSRDQAL